MVIILKLPADSVAQLVERLRDKLKAWVQILANVRFLICSLVFSLPYYTGKALDSSILTRVYII